MLSRSYLTDPVPIGTLVFLRIGIGLLGGGDILGNGIYYHWYLGAFDDFTFRYYGFEWVHPLPEPFFSLFFVVGFLAGLAVAVGWRFRWTAPLLATCFLYLYLLEKAHYLNHAYLFCWLAALLVLTPAWRELSFDVWRKPTARSRLVPRWSIALFPFLMGVVYFFGGIAKINGDWLLRADPLHDWISGRADSYLIGPLLRYRATAFFMAWGGFLLDISIAFLLLHKRLRWLALAGAVFFHLCNHLIFNIGIFPYLSLVMTSLWFEPDWPGRFLRWLAGKWPWLARRRLAWMRRFPDHHRSHTDYRSSNLPHQGEAQTVPITYTGHNPFRGQSLLGDPSLSVAPTEPFVAFDRPVWTRPLAVLLVGILALHFFLPLRHHLIPGDVGWTEEGHRYSWRMMLRSKRGYGHFRLVRPDGTEERVRPRDHLLPRQARKLFTHPDMVLQYAHHLADNCATEHSGSCQIYAEIKVRFNAGKYHPYIDPTVDLARVAWTWTNRKSWILPEGSNE